ncbi:MAG: DUF4124 domain-containing protein [Legionella longbeachae]|nr:DUF4124 domain-containing protein [Legionella longbeachae]
MNKFFVFLSLMIVICASYAQIYKWIDNQGNVHYSDVPHEGAEILSIPDVQNISAPTSPNSSTPPSITENNPSKQQNTYANIAIVQPEAGATIRNNQGFVEVSVQVEPNLFPGDKLQLIYDNSPLGQPQRNLVFELSGMYRGSHTVAVQILDREGNVVETTEPITIYVFRPRVGMVPGTRPH